MSKSRYGKRTVYPLSAAFIAASVLRLSRSSSENDNTSSATT
jgi:hypothetical protein